METVNELTKEQADALYALLNVSSGWSHTNAGVQKTFDADNITLHELADVVATMVDALKASGILTD